MIGFDIKIDADELTREVQRATAEKIRSSLRKIISGSEQKCRVHFRTSLENSKVYRALANEVTSSRSMGLMGELGLETPETTRSAIVSETVSQLSIRPMTVRSSSKIVTDFGGIKIVIVPSNYLYKLLASTDASYISNDNVIPWLYWLLYSGTEIVIADYRVKYGGRGGASRTGDAVMVPNGTGTKQGFAIASSYAGVEGDNWITRAAYATLPKIQNELEDAIRKVFL